MIDAAGKPMLVHGESAWFLITDLTREEAEQYMQDRKARGVNTLLVMLINRHIQTPTRPFNRYGQGPFTTPDDFSTPNEAYFQHADWVLTRAAQLGFLVLLAPSYTGYMGVDEGWYQQMLAAGTTKLRNYGAWVGNRYRNYTNILWVQGGDYSPPDRSVVRAVAEGIRSVETRSLHTFHGGRGTEAMAFWGTAEPWLSVNDTYTDESGAVAAAFTAYNRSTAPFFLIEARYENEGASEQIIRGQAYQTILAGGSGHVMGNRPIWFFGSGWQSQLNSRGSQTFTHVRNFFEARAWNKLVPDINASFLTAGLSGGIERASAAVANDGSFAAVYTPSLRDLSVNMARLAGPRINARWYDPSTGNYTVISGSPFANTGSMVFRPAGANANGYGDWVLLLESTQ